MPLIDGIGDEVMWFGIVLIVLLVAVLAWQSTNARPDRYRAVILMRSRGHAVTVSIRSRQGTRITRARPFVQSPSIDLSDTRAARAAVNSSIQSEREIPLQEMDSIVDADLAMMDNNRLHFYRRVRAPAAARTMEETASPEASETAEEPEPAQNDQIREMDSIVSAMEADLVPADSAAAANDASSTSVSKEDESTAAPGDKDEAAPSATHSTEPDASNQRKILIKLKYINDTLKEVEGSLDEPLKDFKCRHFSAELGSESRVRLIFNGRVLLDEAATLRACGLHDRAVVHCLVQPARPATPTQPQSNPERTGTMHEMVTEMINPERYWDLENILMTLISLALTVVWFFRCEYSNMFTASASVALFGLTVFYSVAIFGLYLSDTFHFERRPARQRLPRN